MRSAVCCLLLLILIIAAGLIRPAFAADPPGPMKSAVAAKLQGKLVIDGKIDEKAWDKAPLQTGFETLLGTGERKPIPPEKQTSFRVLYDDENLYFGIRCNEPNPSKLVVEAARVHDAAMWADDDVELFFDPVGDRDQYYQLTVNSEGTQVDLYMIEGGNTGKAGWSSEWKTATFIGKDFWSVEIAIPFALFHNRPSKMWADRWVFSMSRTRSVTPDNYYSQYSPGYGYNNIKNYGYLDGLKIDKSKYNLYAESPAFRLEPKDAGFAVIPSLMVENRGDKAFDGTLTMDIDVPGAKGCEMPLKLEANSKTRITLPEAFVKEEGKWPVIFRAVQNKTSALVTRFDSWLSYTPITVKITQPNYRNTIYATQTITTIKGNISLGMPLEKVKGATARVTLSSTLMPSRTTESTISDTTVSFELPAADLPEGIYVLHAEVLQPIANPKSNGSKFDVLCEKEVSLRKMPLAPAIESRIDDQGNLIINGNPVFIRGWYGSMSYVVGNSSFPMAQLPHSTNFMMGASDYEASNMGLYTLVDVSREIDEAKAKLDQPIDDQLKAKFRDVIAKTRMNRNVIGYYTSDEPECRGLSPVFLQSVYDFMAQEDPYRFCKIVSRSPVEYMQACDVMCPHPYMSPMLDDEGKRSFGTPIRAIHNNMVDGCAANDGSKAMWAMPQTFSYGGARGQNPTFKESRWFVYTSMANGAKGIVPFIFNGYWNHLENRIAMDYIFEDLTLLAPAWLERDAATEAKSDNPDVDVIAKHAKISENAQTYIMTANQSYDAKTATFDIPALAKDNVTHLLVVRENRVIPVVNGKFTDTFEGIGAHLYTSCEVLPNLKTVDEITQEIAAALDRPVKTGNLLANKKIKWAVGDFGTNFSSDDDLADGANDAAGWLPVYAERGFCQIVFKEPVTFSRVEMVTPTIKDADLQIWKDGDWKTIHQWRDQLLQKIEYSGEKVTTDKLRIVVVTQRKSHKGWDYPEISELGIYE